MEAMRKFQLIMIHYYYDSTRQGATGSALGAALIISTRVRDKGRIDSRVMGKFWGNNHTTGAG